MENVRKDLVSSHASSVQEFENNLMKIQHERQLVFQDAFQNDLKTFKEIGKIPSKLPFSDDFFDLLNPFYFELVFCFLFLSVNSFLFNFYVYLDLINFYLKYV